MAPSDTSGQLAASQRRRPAACDMLETIERRWTLHILLCLNRRAHRFSDLKEAIPRISPKVLTERMRALEGAGLVERQYLPPPSASHVYLLTDSAVRLKPILDALAIWQAGERELPACAPAASDRAAAKPDPRQSPTKPRFGESKEEF